MKRTSEPITERWTSLALNFLPMCVIEMEMRVHISNEMAWEVSSAW